GEVVCSDEFSMHQHCSASSSGWQGRAPPKKIQEELRGLYESGEILQLLQVFLPIPYPLSKAIQALLGNALMDQSLEKKCKLRPRGPHFPCIIGHQQQYQQSTDLTVFHKNNLAKVEVFMKAPIIIQIKWRGPLSFIYLVFPGVAEHFNESSSWYKKRGIMPLFSVYWNLTLWPYADRKNIVGVCTLLVYELPGTNFNHTMGSWLVILESGVVIELPPWVLLLYPSSLLYHFNIDIHGRSPKGFFLPILLHPSYSVPGDRWSAATNSCKLQAYHSR
ncbi:hypothetical protein L208DRAFT_1294107, partial [Tricholoma matsutake]